VGRLVIASYNVHRCIGLDGRCDPERIAAVIGELDADVVGLQEVASCGDDAAARGHLETIAHASGYECFAGPTWRLRGAQHGNGVLFRCKLRARRLVDLSVPGLEPRGAIDVELEHEEHVLRLVVTHLGLRGGERSLQVARLLDLFAAHGEQAAVLLGDFNEWRFSSRLLHRLHESFGRPISVRSFPSFFPILALDRIWVRPRSALRELTTHRSRRARLASDHLPIRAVLGL
jgi:endonuclease/exonuclease/phosphatase family metal-dependent hydrolase